MKTGYNTRLRQNAENSALYGTAAMLFLCDSDFHVCMKSFVAENGIKRPIIGADITTRMDGDLTASFAKAGLDGVKGQIFIDTELYDVIVYSGRLYKDNYIVLLLDEGINIPSIKSALILSSNDDYREFVQRRGRILRKYNNKKNFGN